MIRVAIVGAAGTGKDTLARLLSTELIRYSPLKGKLCKVRQIQEFSVLWVDKTGGTKEVFEQAFIFNEQRRWDHDYDTRKKDQYTIIIGAAPASLAYFYALAFVDIKNYKHRLLLVNLYEKAISEFLMHDEIFYLPIEFEVPAGDRLRNPSTRIFIDRALHSMLMSHKIPFTKIDGSENKRTDTAFRIIKKRIAEKTN
ncbi:AAA family ATPase [Patescibacteria group bacterium]|nr:AAA family ATPase [Patescibacteria group bacterium]